MTSSYDQNNIVGVGTNELTLLLVIRWSLMLAVDRNNTAFVES